jgi:repressor LexA
MTEYDRASKKQQELLNFVDGFIQGNGFGPSYREIMRGLGYKSVSTVAIHIENLIAKGYLIRKDKSARSLAVVSRTQPLASGKPEDAVETELKKRLAGRDLTAAQRETAITGLRLLGFELAAEPTKEVDGAH